MRRVPLLFVLTGVALVAVLVLLGQPATQSFAQPPAEEEAAEPAPPADQTYVGAKECASCHFKQYITWKKTPHANTFKLLPDNYATDAKCLQCHSTGYGKPTGFKDISSTPSLAGTTCEACHGPGSKHVEICKQYGQKKLSEEEEKTARDSIWKLMPGNVCMRCHTVQAHKPSETPPELRKK